MYSPHTAIDAAKGGLGDWMADVITGVVSETDGEQAIKLFVPTQSSQSIEAHNMLALQSLISASRSKPSMWKESKEQAWVVSSTLTSLSL